MKIKKKKKKIPPSTPLAALFEHRARESLRRLLSDGGQRGGIRTWPVR